MSDLSKKKCVACDGNIPPFDKSEIHKYLKKVDDWEVKKGEEENFYLIKEFKFKNFEESQKFVNEVGNISEAQGHHPDIIFGWGYAKVQIFTHKIKKAEMASKFSRNVRTTETDKDFVANYTDKTRLGFIGM